MNANWIKKTGWILSVAAATAAGASLVYAQTATAPAPTAATAPGTMPTNLGSVVVDWDKPVASVNDREINNKAFYSILMQVAGMRVLEEVRDWVLIQQACSGAGIPTEGPDFQKAINAEVERSIQEVIDKKIAKDRNEALKILDQTLASKGVTQAEFQLGIQRLAGLRLLAKGRIEVNDGELQQALAAQYGERATVDLLSVSDFTEAAKVTSLIKSGKKPLEIAQSEGLHMDQATISKNADQIPRLRDAIFRLNVGEISAPIPGENGATGYLMAYLEKKDPADPSKSLTDPVVKAQMHDLVYNTKEGLWMNDLLNKLRRESRTTINDPVLSLIAQNNIRAAEAATQAASTQRAMSTSAPAAAPR